MSKLFDDASLAMIPSAYKDGKLYSIRPIPEYGSEEVTNGDFATDTAWTKEAGWTISGGKASYNGSAATNALFQNISATSGTKYRVSFSVVNYVSGSFKAHLSNGSATGASPLITANGDYVFDITATGGLLLFRNVTSFNGSIDNVSVQEIVSSGDFTFSRGSNLAATRVDVNGLIEKGRENLALYSNQFDNAYWISGAGTKPTTTQDQTDPFGNPNNAWTITGAGTQYGRLMLPSQVISTTITTLSFFVKQGTANEITIWTAQSSVASLTYNFDTQVISGANGVYNVIRKVDNIGNGWYRVAMSLNRSSGSSSETWGLKFDGSSDSLILYGAQQEQGLVATDYIETGAQAQRAGILEDMPRLDYSGGASCPSLLLEPQRTNLFDQSEYIHGWFNAGGTSSQNSTDSTSPEGLYNSAVLDASSVRYRSFSISSSANSYSVYAKAKSGSILGLRIDTPATKTTNFDLSDGTIQSTGSGHTASIEAVGDGWYRCIISFTDSIVNAVLQTTSSGSVYVWGAQLELGSYPTSYIPCMGTSQTRSLDSCLATSVSDLIGQTQGTMFVDVTINNISGQTNDPIPISLKGSGSTNSYIALYDDGRVQAVHYGFGSIQANINLGFYGLTNGRHKFAFVYSDNDFKLYIDGALAGVDTTGLVDAQSDVYLGYYNTSFNGAIKNHQSLIFPTALTDSECIALTTL